jgi:hypothetical protein
MKKLMLAMVLCLFTFGIATAQDPGNPDSLMIRSDTISVSDTIIYVWMQAVTDDSVFYFNCPLQFSMTGTGITYSHTEYFATLMMWDDVFDSFVVSEDFLRMFGFADLGGEDNPPLLTSGNRTHILNLVFDVDPTAEDQFIYIDTTYDAVNGSLLFGLIGGVDHFVPTFESGFIQFGNPTGINDEPEAIPTEFALKQNYPNPFNPETNVSFDLPKAQNVTLQVFNILGQHVKTLADGVYEPGSHTVSWNGTNGNGENVPSGIYFYSLRTEEFSKTNKMMLIR